MPDPRYISIADFTYDLPLERIAKHPLPDRDSSKLLIYREGKISEKTFAAIPHELPADSFLIFNSTRVVRARLLMQRKSGATVELFCTDAADTSVDFISLLQAKKEVSIRAFIGNGKRWKEDELLTLELPGNIVLKAKKILSTGAQWIIRLSWLPEELTFAEILDLAGKVPLPPYLDREEEVGDAERYQTVYAKEKGSVAAPTAGLHFTPAVLNALSQKGIQQAEVTLHVGAGTFKPVKAALMEGHEMHREQVFIPADLPMKIVNAEGPVVAVGTTALRTLESLYWFGRKIVLEPGRHFDSLFVGQWEPYEKGPFVPPEVALRAAADWARENNRKMISGYTQLMIAPGYRFQVVKGLITNFHQPQSTLLLLVAAFVGEDFRKVYDYALQHDFRFLSYGDSSLLWRK